MHDFIERYSDGDTETNTSTIAPSITDLVAERVSRRDFIETSAKGAGIAAFSTMVAACGGDATVPGAAGNAQIALTNTATTGGRVATLGATVTGASSLQWTQVAGPPVALSGAATAAPSFVAPGVTAPTPLTFTLTANSANGGVQTGQATVTVSPAVLGFTPVAKNRLDVVTVPAGYNVQVLYRLGDPIAAGVAPYVGNGSDTNFAQRSGDHHDGMYYFGMSATGTNPDPSSNTRGILCINHENITEAYLHTTGVTSTGGVRPTTEVQKEIEAHGVSIIEVTRAGDSGTWSYPVNSSVNRRITPFTPMTINGPARGSRWMRTQHSPDGTAARGTINNCANGFTPWNTYITCEENWAGYFRRDASDLPLRAPKEQVSLARYGRGGSSGGTLNWTTAAPIASDASGTLIRKFNITINPAAPADGTGDFRNEIYQYGWNVEIDPFNPNSVPRKRTAMGRMAHEGAWPGRFIAGVRPAWYMGDDAAQDYIYKFVSNAPWVPADATAPDRLATGDKYLDNGVLYAARFNADGTGVWLPLVFGQGPLTAANTTYAFENQADVCINSRLAGDAVGATRMDRPEWTAVNPANGEMYCTLTNGPARNGTTLPLDAANPRLYVDPPSTARNNRNGHIIRIRETGDTTEALTFTWDIYVFAAGADLDSVNINLSGLTADNDMSSPDGLWFSRTQNAGGVGNPLLWVQTDDGAFTDVSNCMMLVGQPGRVGDGGTRSVTSTLADGTTRTVTTRIGALPGTNLRRFLVGPLGCEITGIDSTPDGRTVFVNIQHPGETGSLTPPVPLPSNWPATQGGAAAPNARPLSATIVITKADGGVVGV
jgi:uncharacterized protein